MCGIGPAEEEVVSRESEDGLSWDNNNEAEEEMVDKLPNSDAIEAGGGDDSDGIATDGTFTSTSRMRTATSAIIWTMTAPADRT